MTPFAGCSIRDASVETVPFVVAILVVILAVIFLPELAMWPVAVFGR